MTPRNTTTNIKPLMACGLLRDKLRYGHNDLHNGIHVTAVAEIMDSRESRSVKRLQLTTRLLQDTPLPDSLVHVQLQLSHRLLCLQSQQNDTCSTSTKRHHTTTNNDTCSIVIKHHHTTTNNDACSTEHDDEQRRMLNCYKTSPHDDEQ